MSGSKKSGKQSIFSGELLGALNRSPEVRSPEFSDEKSEKLRSEAPASGFDLRPQVPAAEKSESYYQHRHRLENEIEQALREVNRLEEAQKPFEFAFYEWDSRLRELHARRDRGEIVGKQTMKQAYDMRMLRGYIWHPKRVPFQDAERWLKGLRRELAEVNRAIENAELQALKRASKKMPRV